MGRGVGELVPPSDTELGRRTNPHTPPKRGGAIIRRVAAGALVMLVVYSLIFEARMAADENDDWWSDSGFFGGVFGFAAAGVSLFAARRAASVELE